MLRLGLSGHLLTWRSPWQRISAQCSQKLLRNARLFSSVDTPADAATAADLLLAKEQPTRPMFPWRHEHKSILLPRLQNGTKEHLMTIPFPTPQGPFAWMYLGYPIWDALLFHFWQKELAENMTYAFQQGVAAILSNAFRVPSEGLIKDDTLHFIYEPKEGEDEEENISDASQVNLMLAPPLRKLFQSAHESGRDQLRIVLETQPVRSVFYRLYAIPFYTSDRIEAQPKIFRTLYNEGRPEWSTVFDTLQEHCTEQIESQGFVETTIAAEVIIGCREKFQVVDAATGAVLQGSEGVPTTQSVNHVVTFEMTSRHIANDEFPYLPYTEPGNWQITDIDDLVSVKKWFHFP